MNLVGTASSTAWDRTADSEESWPSATIAGLPNGREFLALNAVYRPTGGLARREDLARLLDDHRFGDFISLAALLDSGEIFGFEFRRNFWVPMFQFELRDLSSKPGARQVREELAAAFDGWPLAAWFAGTNAWLNSRRPVDLFDSDLPAVLDAARADRFIAAG